MKLARILVALDLTDTVPNPVAPAFDAAVDVRAIVDVAVELARGHDACLHLVSVAQPRDVVLPGPVVTALILAEEENVEWQLRRLVDELGARAVAVTWELLRGEPAGAILEAAHRSGADAIVVGTHGRRGVRRMVLGSVAETVLRRSPCPVVVVPTPPHHAPPRRDAEPDDARET